MTYLAQKVRLQNNLNILLNIGRSLIGKAQDRFIEELDVGLFKKYIPASFLMFKKTLYCKSTFSERWAGHTFCSEYGL